MDVLETQGPGCQKSKKNFRSLVHASRSFAGVLETQGPWCQKPKMNFRSLVHAFRSFILDVLEIQGPWCQIPKNSFLSPRLCTLLDHSLDTQILLRRRTRARWPGERRAPKERSTECLAPIPDKAVPRPTANLATTHLAPFPRRGVASPFRLLDVFD